MEWISCCCPCGNCSVSLGSNGIRTRGPVPDRTGSELLLTQVRFLQPGLEAQQNRSRLGRASAHTQWFWVGPRGSASRNVSE